MLKKSASARRPLFGLSGFSRFWLNEANQMNQISQINKTNQFEHPARDVAVRHELPKLLGIVSVEG